MSKRLALGKGLSALIEQTTQDSSLDSDRIQNLPLDLISPNPDQPRKRFDQQALKELSDSIIEKGILQPIIVTPHPKEEGKFMIVAGERRYRASKMAGLTTIPAIVRDLQEIEILELSLIENIQREGLNPIEEAMAYKLLIDYLGITQDQLGEKLGKNRSAITNTMRLLRLSEQAQIFITEGKISEGHGKALLGLEDEGKCDEIAEWIVAENASVRMTEKKIQEVNHPESLSEKEKQVRIERYPEKVKTFAKDVMDKFEAETYKSMAKTMHPVMKEIFLNAVLPNKSDTELIETDEKIVLDHAELIDVEENDIDPEIEVDAAHQSLQDKAQWYHDHEGNVSESVSELESLLMQRWDATFEKIDNESISLRFGNGKKEAFLQWLQDQIHKSMYTS